MLVSRTTYDCSLPEPSSRFNSTNAARANLIALPTRLITSRRTRSRSTRTNQIPIGGYDGQSGRLNPGKFRMSSMTVNSQALDVFLHCPQIFGSFWIKRGFRARSVTPRMPSVRVQISWLILSENSFLLRLAASLKPRSPSAAHGAFAHQAFQVAVDKTASSSVPFTLNLCARFHAASTAALPARTESGREML